VAHDTVQFSGNFGWIVQFYPKTFANALSHHRRRFMKCFFSARRMLKYVSKAEKWRFLVCGSIEGRKFIDFMV